MSNFILTTGNREREKTSELMDCSLPGSSVHGISRQEYWSGLPFPSPGAVPNPGIEPASPALAGGFFTAEPSGKPVRFYVLAL